MKELRQYQLEAKDKLRKSIAKGNKRIIYYLPTGGGKSIAAVDLIDSLLKKGKKIAFIANRIGLVNQFSEHLTEANIPHGIIQGANTFGALSDVVVCSIATVGRRGLPPKIDFVIIDEAHSVAGSNEYKKLIFQLNNIYWVGLTATPFSKGLAKIYQELSNEPLFQDIIVGATIPELIKLGSLVDCTIYSPSEPDLKNCRLQKNGFGELDYNEDDLGQAIDKPELIGDIVSHWFKIAKNSKTVVFATNVRHSKHIVDEFLRYGIATEHLDGYMTAEQKKPILDRYASGETLVISNVALLREGWDTPSCSTMILARSTRSLISWIQMCGRVLRPHTGKECAVILDHSGTAIRLGYPTDELPLKLCDGTKPESKKDKPEKKDIKCPSCHHVKKQRGKCEKCGHEPEYKHEKSDIEVLEGTLKKLERKPKAEVKSKDVCQAWYSQLLCYAKSKGYKSGWAANQYKNKFGVYPRGLHEGHASPSVEILNWVISRQIAYSAMQRKLGK